MSNGHFFLQDVNVPGLGAAGRRWLVGGPRPLQDEPYTEEDEKKIKEAAKRLNADDIDERDGAHLELDRLGRQFPELVRRILLDLLKDRDLGEDAAVRAGEILGGQLGPIRPLNERDLEGLQWSWFFLRWVSVPITLANLQRVAPWWIRTLRGALAEGLAATGDINWIIDILLWIQKGWKPTSEQLALLKRYFELLFKEMREQATIIVRGKTGLGLLRRETVKELERIRKLFQGARLDWGESPWRDFGRTLGPSSPAPAGAGMLGTPSVMGSAPPVMNRGQAAVEMEMPMLDLGMIAEPPPTGLPRVPLA